MRKTVKLTENDLTKLVKRVINEGESNNLESRIDDFSKKMDELFNVDKYISDLYLDLMTEIQDSMGRGGAGNIDLEEMKRLFRITGAIYRRAKAAVRVYSNK